MVLDTTTCADYKVTNRVFDKRIRLCICGNQQEEGVHYILGSLYALVMKASAVLFMMDITARDNLFVFKTDTKQAFLTVTLERK